MTPKQRDVKNFLSAFVNIMFRTYESCGFVLTLDREALVKVVGKDLDDDTRELLIRGVDHLQDDNVTPIVDNMSKIANKKIDTYIAKSSELILDLIEKKEKIADKYLKDIALNVPLKARGAKTFKLRNRP